MVKSHPAHHTVPMKVWCSIRIFRISSPCASVPTIPSAVFPPENHLTRQHCSRRASPIQINPHSEQFGPEQTHRSRIHSAACHLTGKPALPRTRIIVPEQMRRANCASERETLHVVSAAHAGSL